MKSGSGVVRSGVFIWGWLLGGGVFPLGHLAFAYLWYVVYAVAASRRLPARWVLVPLFLGSQAPDLVDKPLAYYGVVAYGRSFAHSLFTFAIVSVLVRAVARRSNVNQSEDSWRYPLVRLTPVAFAVGYGSHILADAYRALFQGKFYEARWLLWPVYRLPPGQADGVPPWIRLLDLSKYTDSETHLGVILVAVGVFAVIRVAAWRRGRPIQEGEYGE